MELSNEAREVGSRWLRLMADWAKRYDVPDKHFEYFCVGIWVMFDLFEALKARGFVTQKEVEKFGPEGVLVVAHVCGGEKRSSDEWLKWFAKLWEGKGGDSCQDKR
jgi:hypothetical protein